MGLMNAFDSQTEDSSPAIGRNLRSRPLARKKLSEMVEEELEQMIRRREFGEGEQLPSERELMAFFNVGRPSVREALAALKRKGLVQINNGERARVSRPSADTIIGELSGMAKDFLSHLAGLPISNNYVCSLNPAWCAMRLNTPPMSKSICWQKHWKSTVSRWITTRHSFAQTLISTAFWRRSPVTQSSWRSTLPCSTG